MGLGGKGIFGIPWGAVPMPIAFGSLGTATKAIDLSSSGLSGSSDYWLYFGATDFWRADGRIECNSGIRIGDNVPVGWGDNSTAGDAKINWGNAAEQLIWHLDSTSKALIFADMGISYTKDYDHANQSNPTLFVHSNLDPDTRNDEFATLSHDTMRVGADYGAYCQVKSITEEVTIAVGSGLDPVVATSGNLAPASCMILGATFRVTDAPGGGATTIDIGRTGGANLDEFIDGKSCDVLNEYGNTLTGDGDATVMPLMNSSADTLTLTTDADVTDDDMKVRVTVFYIDMSHPTA